MSITVVTGNETVAVIACNCPSLMSPGFNTSDNKTCKSEWRAKTPFFGVGCNDTEYDRQK